MSAHPTMVQWSRVARIMDKLPDKRAKAAVFALREYVDRANLEFDRLDSEQGEFLKRLMKAQPTIEVGLSISCDTHYLTICLDKIEPTLELLARTFGKGDKDFRIARRTFVGWSRPYEKIRDALEHVNERMAKGLPAGGTVKDGSYTFVGLTVRIDQTARRELNEFTEELLAKMEKLLGVVTS